MSRLYLESVQKKNHKRDLERLDITEISPCHLCFGMLLLKKGKTVCKVEFLLILTFTTRSYFKNIPAKSKEPANRH